MLWVKDQYIWKAIGSSDVIYPWGEAMDGGYLTGYIDGYKYIISDKSAEAVLMWKTTRTATPDTTSTSDGAANTAAMVAAGISDHPAGEHCVDYRGGGFSDWFMLAEDEWEALFPNIGRSGAITPAIFKSGGAQEITAAQWGSNEISDILAYRYNNADGSGAGYPKDTLYSAVRPFRKVLV